MVLRVNFGSWLLPLPVFLAFLVASASAYPQRNKLRQSNSWKSLDFDFFNPASAYPQRDKLKQIISWKSLDFDFLNPASRKAAIDSKAFIPGRPVPIDVDVYYGDDDKKDDKIFVTIPRFQDGVPVTLGTVTKKTNSEGNPLIAPYPNWAMQQAGGKCKGITSVYRIAVDTCHRLWVMDTGKLGEQQACPPQLLVYSLKTNLLLKRHVFPKNQYRDSSLFITPSVDIRNTCDDTFVYIADVGGFSLMVYDHRNSRSWRIVNNLFYPYPDYGTFEISNDSFDLMDGIFGLALGPIKQDGDRILYFHSLASRKESWVPTSVIRNRTIFENDATSSARSFKTFQCERSSQAGAQAMDRNGVLFYGLMSDMAIGCWNSKDYPEFGGRNIEKVVTNNQTLQFASGMKVVNPRYGESQELWVITVSFQKFMAGTMRPDETNFRIQTAHIDELVRKTKCQVSRQSSPHRRVTNSYHGYWKFDYHS